MQEEKQCIDGGVATPIAIAVVEHNDHFLIGRRPEGGALAGFWEFPGGKIHPGESFADCAIRECFEETGVAVEVTRLQSNRVHEYDHGTVHLHFFHCTPVDPEQPPRAPFRWVRRESLSAYEFPSANAELIACLSQAKCTRSEP
jgi:mutator protein MutT